MVWPSELKATQETWLVCPERVRKKEMASGLREGRGCAGGGIRTGREASADSSFETIEGTFRREKQAVGVIAQRRCVCLRRHHRALHLASLAFAARILKSR